MLAPPRLQRGDRVRIVAPSGCFDRPSFAAGVSCLERAGLVPVYDDGLFARYRYLAGSDERRLAELDAALADPAAPAVWIARGGYGATRLLDGLDPERVRAAGKWLVGFSDATALHALWQRAGVVSLHGPNVTTVDGWGADARRALWDCLFEGKGPVLRGRRARGAGAVTGPLHGGNLTVLAALAAARQLPSWEGAVVLLEDVGERPYRLDRALTSLVQGGALRGVAAVVVGQLTGCEEPPERTADFTALDVICEVLARARPELPVLTDVPVGHEPTSFALPLGARATVDLDAGTLSMASPVC